MGMQEGRSGDVSMSRRGVGVNGRQSVGGSRGRGRNAARVPSVLRASTGMGMDDRRRRKEGVAATEQQHGTQDGGDGATCDMWAVRGHWATRGAQKSPSGRDASSREGDAGNNASDTEDENGGQGAERGRRPDGDSVRRGEEGGSEGDESGHERHVGTARVRGT